MNLTPEHLDILQRAAAQVTGVAPLIERENNPLGLLERARELEEGGYLAAVTHYPAEGEGGQNVVIIEITERGRRAVR